MTISPSSGFRYTQIIISPTPGLGTHTTFAAAIAAASANQIIFVREGTYVENPVIDKNLTFTCYAGDDRYVNGDVILQGKITVNADVSATFTRIDCSTNGDSLLVYAGNQATFTFDTCDLSIEAGVIGIVQAGNNTNNTYLTNSYVFISSTGQLLNLTGGGVCWIDGTTVEGTGIVASTISSGSVVSNNSIYQTAFTTSGSNTSSVIFNYCIFGVSVTPYINTTWLNIGSTSQISAANYCQFYSGTASCASISSGCQLNLYKCMVHSTNTNALTGSGTLAIDDITYLSSQGNNVSSLQSRLVGNRGTFTPTLQFGGGSTGITYSLQEGNYIIVGQIAIIMWSIVLSNKGSSTGSATISLPFATYNNVTFEWPLRFENLTFTGQVFARQTGTTLYLESAASGAGLNALTNTSFANNTLLQGSAAILIS